MPHRPSAHSHGRVSTQSWALCVGCPRLGRAVGALCWVLQGHEVPQPGPHGTRHRRQWHRPALHWHSDCSPVPAVPSPTGLQSHCPSPQAPRGWTRQQGPVLWSKAALPALRSSVPGGRARRGRPRCLPWREAAPSSRRADGKQSMEFARLKVKYNTHTDFVRGPGTAAFVGSD